VMAAATASAAQREERWTRMSLSIVWKSELRNASCRYEKTQGKRGRREGEKERERGGRERGNRLGQDATWINRLVRDEDDGEFFFVPVVEVVEGSRPGEYKKNVEKKTQRIASTTFFILSFQPAFKTSFRYPLASLSLSLSLP
jgi:hypothetical protein